MFSLTSTVHNGEMRKTLELQEQAEHGRLKREMGSENWLLLLLEWTSILTLRMHPLCTFLVRDLLARIHPAASLHMDFLRNLRSLLFLSSSAFGGAAIAFKSSSSSSPKTPSITLGGRRLIEDIRFLCRHQGNFLLLGPKRWRDVVSYLPPSSGLITCLQRPAE